MRLTSVLGVSEVRASLRAANKLTGQQLERNLKKAGLLLQRMSQKIVPVKYGNLKNSAGTRAIGSGKNTTVAVFYTAAYAVYVHERLDLRHKRGKQAKFLEGPARWNRKQILAVIAGRPAGDV